MNEQELYHYGVLGMKWGIRRTPEQLGNKKSTRAEKKIKKANAKKMAKVREAKKKAAAERAKKEAWKKKVLDNPELLYKYRKQFSKAEIDEAMKQFEWENRLRDMSNKRISQGAEKAAKFLAVAGTVVGGYNLIARVVNSFDEDSNMPYIRNMPGADEKKKK